MTPHHYADDDRRTGDDRRESDERLNVQWSIVFQVLGYILGLFVVYNAMTGRLTALETNRANDAMRMERMENKLDQLLQRKQ